MGAEREDTDPNANRVGTEPGIGRSSSEKTPAAAVHAAEEEAPPPVDFDALHAALGDPLDYVEMPSGPALEKGEPEEELIEYEPEPAPRKPLMADSSGRSSAKYASAGPHTIPPTRQPSEDLNAPPVIVASDDTVPSAPPQMTVPLMTPGPQHVGPSFGTRPHLAPLGAGAPGAPPIGPPGSNPRVGAAVPGHPSSGSHASAVNAFVQTPPPFPALPRGMHQMTMRMHDRPLNPRRQRTQTLVVRARGPSLKKRFITFVALLVILVTTGICVLLYKPAFLYREPVPVPTPAAAPATAPTSGLGSGSSLGSPVVVAPAGGPVVVPVDTGAAASSSAARKLVKPPALPPR